PLSRLPLHRPRFLMRRRYPPQNHHLPGVALPVDRQLRVVHSRAGLPLAITVLPIPVRLVFAAGDPYEIDRLPISRGQHRDRDDLYQRVEDSKTDDGLMASNAYLGVDFE